MKILLSFLLCLSVFAQKSPKESLIEVFGEEYRDRIYDNYVQFTNQIDALAPNTIIEYVGFSGADYLNKEETFVKDFMNLSNALTSGETVHVLGGTYDGIGSGYKILKGMNASNKVIGMVSEKAVKYEIEYQNVLAKENDLLLLVNSYSKEGNQTWELKENINDSSFTQLIMQDYCQKNANTHLVVFEGGGQSVKEIFELINDANEGKFNCTKKINLHLVLGYTPLKAKKDKGYRAASQIAYALSKRLIKGQYKRNIKVNLYEAAAGLKKYTLFNFPRKLKNKFFTQTVIEKTKEELIKPSK